jgi:integrase
MRSRIYQRGKKWYIDYEGPDGRRVREKVGNKLAAENALAAVRADVLRGEYRFAQDVRIRLKDFEDEYLDYVKSRQRACGIQKQRLKNLMPFFGDKFLSKITLDDIIAYKKMRRQTIYYSNEDKGIMKTVKGATVNRELACLRHVFNVAKLKKKFFTENPIRHDEFYPEPKKIDRILDREEIARLLESAAPHLKLAITLALCTGLRKSEILAIKWKNIDFQNRLIIIEKTKSGRMLEIPMNEIVLDLLAGLERQGEFVFHNEDSSAGHLLDIKRSFNTARKKAKLPEFRFHDLRHCAGTYMIMGGAPLVTVSRILGHASARTTERYLHPTDENKRRAVDVLGALFLARPEKRGTAGAQMQEEAAPTDSSFNN